MAQLLIAHHRHYNLHRSKFRQPVPMKLRVGKFFLMFSMILLAGLMSMLYLMHFTDIHTKGYSLRKLEIEREALRSQQEIKVMNVAKVRALEHVQAGAKVTSMVPLRNPIYLKDDTAVAKR